SLGAPQLAGSEAARGPLYGFLDMVEGAQRSPSGCDATKIRILGSAQYKIVEDDQYPDDVPFQVVTLGDQLLLAAVPGEPTTELGLEIERHVQAKAKGIAHYAVLGLTNGYSTYWTLPGEFLAQHYEGGATLYGPYQGILAIDQLERLAGELGQPWAIDYRPYRVFSPGEPTHFFPGTRNCDEEDWEAGDTIVHAESVDFSWDGIPDDQHCPYPEVRVECGGNLLHDPQGYPQSDRWFPFQIWREGKHRWTARWSQHAATTADCRIVVRGATKVLQSELLPTREP
ncbi:MAG: neutral/alkaline non-lysosomal ceramidase N-terminal domain-containing protein, partial [Myxococcales bacterium]|nr:neutral/alkaline non-lysosomal ceramidase N-terminal domain-containing protein [Myxococcales bacterium]